MPTHLEPNALPPHARLIARDDVWMEGDAILQLAKTAALPGCVAAAGMPDLHVGPGIPIGAVFAFADAVHPLLVGGDAGCGVRVIPTRAGRFSADALERRVEQALEDDPLEGADPEELFEAVWAKGPRGLSDVGGIPDALSELAAREPDDGLGPSGDAEVFRAGFGSALGTVGGGNHFAEIARVTRVDDKERAGTLGFDRGALVVVAHSGSRGLGGALGRRWADQVLQGGDILLYMAALNGACRFARANRLVLAYRLLRALGCARPDKAEPGFDVTHNDVRREPVGGALAWVHRKGAAPARGSDPTIVLGSRGAPSWILESLDAEAGLRSVAHGAGRRMGRTEAREKIRARYKRAQLTRTDLGGRVLCADQDLLYEEHPDAYKPIEPVVASLVDAGLARPLVELTPVVTVKR